MDEAAADVLDRREESREHHDPGDDLEGPPGFPPDPWGRGNLASELSSHRAGIPAAARRTGSSVTRRDTPKRNAVAIAMRATS